MNTNIPSFYWEYRTYLMRHGEESNYAEMLLTWEKAANDRGHEFQVFGPFRTIVGEQNEVSYYFVWDSLAGMERAWTEIYKDEELLKVGLPWWEREQNEGPIMQRVNSQLLRSLEPPPEPHKAKLIYELRTYTFKTSEAHRMRTEGLEEIEAARAHGFRVIGPLIPKFGCENEVTYLFQWESLAEYEDAWTSFENDKAVNRDDWYVREKNEGPLRYSCVSKLVRTM